MRYRPIKTMLVRVVLFALLGISARGDAPALPLTPGVKANNSDGPLTITPNELVEITISLAMEHEVGPEGDWWILVKLEEEWYHFDRERGWLSGLEVSHQGSLFALEPYTVLSGATLPEGTFTFFFGVDPFPNGIPDIEGMVYDSLTLRVSSEILNEDDGGESDGDTGSTVDEDGESDPSLCVAFRVPDTHQTGSYTDTYGEDSDVTTYAPSYTDNGNGTVTDNVTGLMWTKTIDLNGDGKIDVNDKLGYEDAQTYASSVTTGGYTDWRVPTIKELYSLMDFSGQDISSYSGTETSGLTPFIDTTYFAFDYGDMSAGERLIDSQMATTTKYVSLTFGRDETMFGVNFADGRIKGYPIEMRGSPKLFYVYFVRGDTGYGENDFVDNRDGTVTDAATGRMWSQDDSGKGLNWEEALAWVNAKNQEKYLGYNDWRLPDAKELQALVDYTRSPDTSASAAIDPVFKTTSIVNEGGETDWPWFWSSTTALKYNPQNGAAMSDQGAYVCFGRALGYMNGEWLDVHGAGCQRTDPKAGDPTEYPTGYGPQGDAIRIYNYVRLVRDITVSGDAALADSPNAYGNIDEDKRQVTADSAIDKGVLLLDLIRVSAYHFPFYICAALRGENFFIKIKNRHLSLT